MPVIFISKEFVVTAFEKIDFGVDFVNWLCVLMKTPKAVWANVVGFQFFFNYCGIWKSRRAVRFPL